MAFAAGRESDIKWVSARRIGQPGAGEHILIDLYYLNIYQLSLYFVGIRRAAYHAYVLLFAR